MKTVIPITLILLLFGCLTESAKNYHAKSDIESILNEFEFQLEKDLKDDNLNGSISMTIVKGNEVLRSKSFGRSNFTNQLADSSTIYRIGSVTKSFTAFLMMQLEQDGFFELDDPIENYLLEIRQLEGYSDKTKITFRQLASHTSGLNSGPNLGRPSDSGIEKWESEILECIPVTGFGSPPGQRYAYSNVGYGILGYAISRAAKKPYIDLVQNRIFEPLNMKNSYFKVPDNKEINLAKGRWGGPMGGYDEERPKKDHQGRGWSIPNGGIYSTTNDLAKFMFATMGFSQIVKDENLSLMQTTQTPNGRWYENYGLGFTIYSDNAITTVGHQGGTPGYRANFLFEKDSQYGVILLRNYNSGTTDLNLRSTVLLRKLKEAGLRKMK